MIMIFHNESSCSVSISCLSSFTHLIEDKKKISSFMEDISLKITELNLKHSLDIFIREKLNFSSLLTENSLIYLHSRCLPL